MSDDDDDETPGTEPRFPAVTAPAGSAPRTDHRFPALTAAGPTPRTDPDETRKDSPAARDTKPRSRPPPEASLSVFDPPESRFTEGVELGRGGMGRVVEAFDRALDRPVAIKHSLAHSSTDLARFEREVRITARLQHPGVVPILDVGRDEAGQPFYIMRKIDGDPLGARVNKATSVRARLALLPEFLGAVEAAAYAHAQGVIHRDIKPANILLGRFGEALLIDWGIARVLDESDAGASRAERMAALPGETDEKLTHLGLAYGTPGFMAPEQARGEVVDRRADVYSLGATLYFILSGALPFGGEPSAVIARIAVGELPDLARIPAEVPAELTAIASKALSAEPDARYADGSELAADLRRFLAGQLVAAHAYTARERVWRWIRRHRFASVTTVLALAVIAVISVIAIRRVVDERDRVRVARQLAEARAEELIVERARSLVGVDPTSAIAVLRTLPEKSPSWPIARAIVQAAVAGGVERGFVVHAGPVFAIGVATDGRVATAGADGTIRLVDLVRGTSRVLAPVHATSLLWLDARTLAYAGNAPASEDTVHGLIDVETGTVHRLKLAGARDAVVANGHLLVRTASGAIMSFGPDGRQLPGTDMADAIHARNGRIAMASRDRIVVLDGTGARRVLAVAIANRIFNVRISASGNRVAVHMHGAVLEWDLTRDEPARTWPRPTTGLGSMDYAGDTLYSWSTTGSAFELLADQASTAWSIPGTPLPVAATSDGVMLATREGAIAYRNALGTYQLPHRTADIRAMTVGADGKVLLGTTLGELLVLDLDGVRPQLSPAAGRTTLLAMSTTHVALAEPREGQSPGAPTDLVLLELASSKRHVLVELGFNPAVWLSDREILAFSGTGVRQLLGWTLDGHKQLEQRVEAVAVSKDGDVRSVYYVTPDGDLYASSLDSVEPPTLLAKFPGRIVNGSPRSPVFGISPATSGVIVGTFDDTGAGGRRTYWIDRRRTHDLALPLLGHLHVAGPMPDGTWWVTEDYEHLWRVPAMGVPIEIALGQPISHVMVRGEQAWAMSPETNLLIQLDSQGSVLRRIGLQSGKPRVHSENAMVVAEARGALVTLPGPNVRFVLPAPTGVESAVAASEGAFAVIANTVDGGVSLATWRDAVPREPPALRRYLSSLTNARLEPGSDALTWDP